VGEIGRLMVVCEKVRKVNVPDVVMVVFLFRRGGSTSGYVCVMYACVLNGSMEEISRGSRRGQRSYGQG